MKKILFLFALTATIFAAKIPYKDGVYSLNETNFDEFVKNNYYTFVNFFEKNCTESQRYVEPFFKFAEKIKDNKVNLKVAKVDINLNPNLGDEFSIDVTPTFSLLIDSYSLPYDGVKSADSIYNWTVAKMKDNITEIIEDDIAESILENKDVIKVIFNNQDDLYDMANLTIISKFFEEEISFYFTKKASIAKKKFKMSMGTRIMMVNDGDFIKYSGDMSVESIFEFINESKKPIVEELTEANIDNLMDEDNYSGTLVAILKKRDGFKKTKDILKKLTRMEKYSDMSFTWVYQEDRSVGDQLIELVGKKPKEFSFAIIVKSKGDGLEKYLMNKRVSEENLIKFVDDFRAGKLKKLLKSDNEPKYNDEAWKIWIGRNFEKNFRECKSDIIFFFWTKGCNNCPQFNKIFQRLAIRLEKKNKNLLFVKVDGGNNDVEEFDYVDFPKVVFVPANDRTQRNFYDVITTNSEYSLYHFMKDHSSFPWVEIDVPKPIEKKIEKEKTDEEKFEDELKEELKEENVKVDEKVNEEKEDVEAIVHDEKIDL